MRNCRCIVALAFLFIAGCGGEKPKFTEEELRMIPLPQRTGLPAASGGAVLTVAGETITCEEIILPLVEQFRESAKRSSLAEFEKYAAAGIEQIVTGRVAASLLYQLAKKELGEQGNEALEKAVDEEVRKFIASYSGDISKAEETLKNMGHDWASFKEYQKKMILAQFYISSHLPAQKPVTYSEMLEYYNRVKDERFGTQAKLQFQLIDIQPANENTEEPAEDLAVQLVERIRNGEDFGMLAKQYSQGHRAMFEGLWKPVNPDSLAEPYDILAAEAQKMEPGQVSGPIEAAGHIFIMKLLAKQAESSEPFETVQKEIEAEIETERRRKAFYDFDIKLVQQAEVDNKDYFIDLCVERLYLVCNQEE
ncbi:MAG: peptidylprolyl isomerase [Planctomycetota bacterium]